MTLSYFEVDWPNRGEERRRNMEKMMSICFTRFLISGLGEPNIYHNLGEFTRNGEFTWRVVW